MVRETRRLWDLISVGPAMVRDFEILGVRSVGGVGAAESGEAVRDFVPGGAATPGYLLSGCVSGGGGAGAGSAVAGGEMSVVVLEPGEEE
jgi:hypothetical protein